MRTRELSLLAGTILTKPARVVGVASLTGLSLILWTAGCGRPEVSYIDPRRAESIDTDFGASDLQQVAEAMVDSLLVFPPIVDATANRRPVISVDRVKNKTMQHIDTESITDSIRVKLIHSGRFRFIDRTTDDATIEEIKTQLESGLVDKKTARRFGKQIGAEYMLTANLSEINQRAVGVKDVYYKFTMSLKNLQSGILEWSDEKEIRKQSVKALVGW